MRVLGLDIGSRSVDAVWLEDGRIVDAAVGQPHGIDASGTDVEAENSH